MKTIINKILVGSLALAAATACTSDFENINSNPYEPGDLTPDDYAIGSAMNNMASTVMSGDVNTLQFTDCLLGGPLGGYFSDSNAGFTESIIRYNPKDDWSRVFLKSDKVIAQLYSNMTMIEAFAETSGDELLWMPSSNGIADVMWITIKLDIPERRSDINLPLSK